MQVILSYGVRQKEEVKETL